jgi:hypothetical protein
MLDKWVAPREAATFTAKGSSGADNVTNIGIRCRLKRRE